MPWSIRGQVGTHSDPDKDGWGWLWEIARDEPDGEVRQIFVQVTGPARDTTDGLYEETAEAIRTEGLSEVERVAQLDDPPRVIECGTTIVQDVYRPAR